MPSSTARRYEPANCRPYKLGRVFRLRVARLDAYIEASRIIPGILGFLYGDAS